MQMCQIVVDGELQIPGLQAAVSVEATQAALSVLTVTGLSISYFDAIVHGFSFTSPAYLPFNFAFIVPFTGFVPLSLTTELGLAFLDFLSGLPGIYIHMHIYIRFFLKDFDHSTIFYH